MYTLYCYTANGQREAVVTSNNSDRILGPFLHAEEASLFDELLRRLAAGVLGVDDGQPLLRSCLALVRSPYVPDVRLDRVALAADALFAKVPRSILRLGKT